MPLPETVKTIIVCPPVSRPDLLEAFNTLASQQGFVQHFYGRVEGSDETVVVRFDAHQEPAADARCLAKTNSVPTGSLGVSSLNFSPRWTMLCANGAFLEWCVACVALSVIALSFMASP